MSDQEPAETQTIEINITATVTKRDSYQQIIEQINRCIIHSVPELNIQGMNSPLQVRIKIK